MPKSEFEIGSSEKQLERRECQSSVTSMCGSDLCYIGTE